LSKKARVVTVGRLVCRPGRCWALGAAARPRTALDVPPLLLLVVDVERH
jgi:hypothetical protein